MIAYTLKQVLELVPEALPLVKTACVTDEWPVSSKGGCAASFLSAELLKAKGDFVNYPEEGTLQKIATAVEAYGIKDELQYFSQELRSRFSSDMQKAASSSPQEELMVKQASFQGDGFGKDLIQLAKQASILFSQAKELDQPVADEVGLYACDRYLNKEAALGALGARHFATGDSRFLKIASALGGRQQHEFSPQSSLLTDLCATVSMLDKQASLDTMGFDFYKEALITKEAAAISSSVVLGGQSVPMHVIQRIPSAHIEHYIDKDLAAELQSDPISAKAAIDALPLDSKNILATLVKHV